MATLSDHLKPKMDALKKIAEDNDCSIIEASKIQHRGTLDRVADKSLNRIETMLPEATVSETIKIYDTAQKHKNTLDGIQDTSAVTIAVIPGELAARFSLQNEIKEQLKETPVIEGEEVK